MIDMYIGVVCKFVWTRWCVASRSSFPINILIGRHLSRMAAVIMSTCISHST